MNPKRAQLALAILFAINLMNFFDRQILGAVGEDIRKQWELSDTALGTLGTAFTLIYALVGLPLGRLADKLNRTRILGAGVFVWSLLTAASGMCSSFGQPTSTASIRCRSMATFSSTLSTPPSPWWAREA